jgi:hypothetical protein
MPRVKHVALLRFKPDTSPVTIAALFAALDGLRQTVPGLLDFSAGANNSTEGVAKGFTHGFLMTFADEASRDGYLPHPEHEAVKAQIIPWLDGGIDGVIVVDWTE